MPKDEFHPQDPLELNGVAFLTNEDTTDSMCDCFIEEFMRMGYGHKQVLALFRNPHYLGMNMVLEKRGEQFVCERIVDIYARWGRPVNWPVNRGSRCEAALSDSSAMPETPEHGPLALAVTDELHPSTTDPMGGDIPKLNL